MLQRSISKKYNLGHEAPPSTSLASHTPRSAHTQRPPRAAASSGTEACATGFANLCVHTRWPGLCDRPLRAGAQLGRRAHLQLVTGCARHVPILWPPTLVPRLLANRGTGGGRPRKSSLLLLPPTTPLLVSPCVTPGASFPGTAGHLSSGHTPLARGQPSASLTCAIDPGRINALLLQQLKGFPFPG